MYGNVIIPIVQRGIANMFMMYTYSTECEYSYWTHALNYRLHTHAHMFVWYAHVRKCSRTTLMFACDVMTHRRPIHATKTILLTVFFQQNWMPQRIPSVCVCVICTKVARRSRYLLWVTARVAFCSVYYICICYCMGFVCVRSLVFHTCETWSQNFAQLSYVGGIVRQQSFSEIEDMFYPQSPIVQRMCTKINKNYKVFRYSVFF